MKEVFKEINRLEGRFDVDADSEEEKDDGGPL